MTRLDEHVETLRKMPPDAEERTKFYTSKIFPAYVRHFRKGAEKRAPCDLLISAVGTQPFSPALAIAGSAPKICALLVTSDTEPIAQTVLQLAGHKPDLYRSVFIGDGMDSALVMSVVRAEYLRWGVGQPERVIVDVTSGRKATAAGLGAAAAHLGLRQAYIESALLQPGSLGINPVYRLLPDTKRLLGGEGACRGLVLLEYGHYVSAGKEFRLLGPRGAALACACDALAISLVSPEAAEVVYQFAEDDVWPAMPTDPDDSKIEEWRREVRVAIAERASEL